ncbi:MAG: zinc-ribbon domain containing protein [Vulcanimicrobiaceae bacterium]
MLGGFREGLVQDKSIACKDCGVNFTFTVREQQFYSEKGFENEPQRCRDCRNARKAQRAQGGPPSSGPREMFEAVCASCGINTTVSFKPRGDRPVYCRTCYTAQAPQPVRA